MLITQSIRLINCVLACVGLYKEENPSSACQSYGYTETESKHLYCLPNFCDCCSFYYVSLRYSDLSICNQPFVIFGGAKGISYFGLRVTFFSVYASLTL